MTWAAAKDLAGLPGMPGTRRGVQDLAARAGWPSRREATRGGYVVLYPVDALPDVTRTALAVRGAANDDDGASHAVVLTPGLLAAAAAGRKLQGVRQAESRASGTATHAAITGDRARERDDKLRLLVLFRRFWDHFGGELCPAMQHFVHSWNEGRIDASDALRARFPHIRRWKTVLEWWTGLDRNGGAALARKPSTRAGRSSVLEGALGRAVLAILHEYPHLGGTQIHRLIEKSIAIGDLQLDAPLPPARTFRHAVTRWKKDNAQLFTLVTNPDRWRSHYMSAAGSRSEAVGPNDLWEMDGTKVDLLLLDGRRWTLTAVIDVGSRRMKCRLSPTARAAVVMGLTRAAMLDWGKPVTIKTDNGSDYVAEQYVFGLALIDQRMHVLCDPFQPQQKPHIERGIGSLLHDLVELLPGFIGHSVAERKDIEARRSFADRLMRGSSDGGPVTIRLQPEQLQDIIDNWLADYHARPHSGLGDRSPNQVMAEWSGTTYRVDPRALDVFLSPANKTGLATVTKKGIRLDHGWFNCAEIGGLEGQQVQVKQTEEDLGTCYVFDLAGRYVGTAIDHARKGISAAEVAAERLAIQKRVMAEQKAALKAAVRAVKPHQLVMNVLQRRTDAAIDAGDNVTRLRRDVEHTSDAIDSVTTPPAAAPRLSAAAAETLARMDAGQGVTRAPVLRLDTPNARYSAFLRLQRRRDAGDAIEPRDLKWADGYAASAECKAMCQLHQGTDPLAAEAGA
ncbi:MAG: DNA-binding protein [Rubrivivax sp.]